MIRLTIVRKSNPNRADCSEWLALRDAAQMIGVHPATLRGFLFFRDDIVDSRVQMAGVLEPIPAPGWPTVHRHLSGFLNEVLLALVQAYEEGRRD